MDKNLPHSVVMSRYDSRRSCSVLMTRAIQLTRCSCKPSDAEADEAELRQYARDVRYGHVPRLACLPGGLGSSEELKRGIELQTRKLDRLLDDYSSL